VRGVRENISDLAGRNAFQAADGKYTGIAARYGTGGGVLK